MFDVPDAKRVRRSELHSPRSTPSATRSPSPATNAQLQARLASLYEPETDNASTLITTRPLQATAHSHSQPQPTSAKAPKPDQNPNQDAAEEEDEGFEFRLFAAPKPSKPTTTTSTTTTTTTEQPKAIPSTARIRISSPSPGAAGSGIGGLVNPHRPQSYYFTFRTSAPSSYDDDDDDIRDAQQKLRSQQFALSAISGTTILQQARQQPHKPWPGCTLPWRVRVLPRAQHRVGAAELVEKLNNDDIGTSGAEVGKKATTAKRATKTKPGKKRRIVLRQRAAKRREEVEKRKMGDEEKEREEREKRTRRNREKKVKRKEREKAKKGEGAQHVDDAVVAA